MSRKNQIQIITLILVYHHVNNKENSRYAKLYKV